MTQDKANSFANIIYQRMKDDPQFINILPSVMSLKSLNTAFEVADGNAADGGKKLTIIKNECFKAMIAQLDVVADGVEALAEGNEKIVLDSGFELVEEAKTINEINMPTGLEAQNDEGHTGCVFTKWKSDKTVVGTMVEFQKVGETTWQNGPFCTANSAILTNLEAGNYYNIRVYGMGRKGLKSNTTASVTVLVS